MAEGRRATGGWRRGAVALLVLLVVAGGAAWWLGRAALGGDSLHEQLLGRGRVAVLGERLLDVSAEGAELVDVSSLEPVVAALAGDDAEALMRALDEARIEAVLVDGARAAPDGQSLRARLGRYEYVPGLGGQHVSPGSALYLRADVRPLEPAHAEALAHVAREVLGGARPPRVSSFPEPLRRVRNVEVMVLLRQGNQPRLWRSARGSSIARALITATVIAKQRWDEREQTMGDALEDVLGRLDVEVSLLAEDGTLGSRSSAFIERVFTDAHGVAFEYRGGWHYLLSEATAEKGQGSATRAYRALFEDKGYDGHMFERDDARFYRLVARPLARSSAPISGSRPAEAGAAAVPQLGPVAGGADGP